MTVIKLAVTAMVVTTGANIVAGKKRTKAQQKANQEAAYIEGASPIIPTSNELMIASIGEENLSPEDTAPDFREALAGSYGGGMYDTQSFDRTPEQIPPELEALLMQQQTSGPEATNVQFSRTGGPVGLPQDVYHFSVPKISQMQMDVDPGVRNVGNAMMAQMEANPGMGMVSASAADIDQMAAGGPVQPRRYEDGSTGGIKAGIKQGLIETVKNQTPGLAQVEILKAIEMTNDPEEKRRLARQLIPGMGLAEMGLGGLRKIGSRIRERRANRQEEAPVLGPQMSD